MNKPSTKQFLTPLISDPPIEDIKSEQEDVEIEQEDMEETLEDKESVVKPGREGKEDGYGDEDNNDNKDGDSENRLKRK